MSYRGIFSMCDVNQKRSLGDFHFRWQLLGAPKVYPHGAKNFSRTLVRHEIFYAANLPAENENLIS